MRRDDVRTADRYPVSGSDALGHQVPVTPGNVLTNFTRHPDMRAPRLRFLSPRRGAAAPPRYRRRRSTSAEQLAGGPVRDAFILLEVAVLGRLSSGVEE